MDNFFLLMCVSIGLVVLIGFFNEKVTRLPNEIALMLFATIIGCGITVVWSGMREVSVKELLNSIQIFNLEKFLLHGVLCFMLFAGSCHLRLNEFARHARQVGVLAFFCTLVGALLYGALFFLISRLTPFGLSLPVCLMFGSIIAPTDPIAATSILRKFGLPKQTGFLMEAESLLNDGVGVALFVFFSGMLGAGDGSRFLVVMVREIFGAVLIGGAVMGLCWQIFRRTEDAHRKIFVSLFAVSLSYLLCEAAGCSGPIACVVAGLCFSTLRERAERKRKIDGLELFNDFWETLDVFFNSLLYIMLGLSFMRIAQMPWIGVLSVVAVLVNLVSRFSSLWLGTWLLGPLPDGYDRLRFSTLFTWGGLRGGLSVALAMSTAALLSSEHYFILLGSTYAVVFFTTVVQGLTVRRVYNRLSAQVKMGET